MQGERIIITVDGVGASGKSALARLLAERLEYAHLNSGLLYRATAWLVSVSGVDPTSNDAVGHLLGQHSISLQYSRDKGTQVSVDGVIKEHELTTQENTQLASLVAKLPSVRDQFKPIQRHAFSPMSVVAEGRDMGTVIFPDAAIKFFVTADLAVRASRRYQQMVQNGQTGDVQIIATELARRDELDSTREIAPMKPAEGAIIVDNSVGSLDETVERMMAHVKPIA
jgi:cytidylate kinase